MPSSLHTFNTKGESVMDEHRFRSICSQNNNNNCLMVLSSDCNLNTPAISDRRSIVCKSSIADDSNQWSVDYMRSRDGTHGGNRMHASILSMCGPPQSTLLSYDDLSRNIDANLAEIDMETFRSEDINSILALPTMYSTTDDYQTEQDGEQTASASASMIDNIMVTDSDPPEAQSSSSGAESAEVMSVCKNEPLFSPMKENTHIPINTVSVDSLDCESYDEQQELIISCQANKGNYTIAFEGSCTHISEDSDYHDADPSGSENESHTWSHTLNNLPNTTSSSSSMVQSDYVFTTWQKLKSSSDVNQKNQDTSAQINNNGPKTRSLPNLARKIFMSGSNDVSDVTQIMDSAGSGQCVRLFDIQGSHMTQSRTSDTSSNQSFSLVRLFVQNKISPDCDKGDPKLTSSNGDHAPNNLRYSLLANTKANDKSDEEDTESFEDSLVDDQKPQNSKKPATTPIREEAENDDTDFSDKDEFSCNRRRKLHKLNPFSKGDENHNVYNQSQGTQTKVQLVKCQDEHLPDSMMKSSMCDSISKKTLIFSSQRDPVVLTKMKTIATQIPIPVSDQSVQTIGDPDAENRTSVIADQPMVYELSAQSYTSQTSNGSNNEKRPVYVCFPNYSLPDLSFLSTSVQSADKYLLKPTRCVTPMRRAHSSDSRESSLTKSKSGSSLDRSRRTPCFHHIHDLDSLKILLPEEYQGMISASGSSINSGHWGSSTSRDSSHSSECQHCRMKTSACSDVPPMLPSRCRSTISDGSRKNSCFEDDNPPPLPPKRSISLPGNSGPKGILRKKKGLCNTNRYSLTEFKHIEPKFAKRCSLQEPLDVVLEKCLNLMPNMKTNFSEALEFVEELSEMPGYLQPNTNVAVEAKVRQDCSNESSNSSCSCQRRNEGLAGSGSTPDSVFTNSNRSFGCTSPERKHNALNHSYQNPLYGYRAKKTVSFVEKSPNKGVTENQPYNADGNINNQVYDRTINAVSPTKGSSFMNLNTSTGTPNHENNDSGKVVIDLKKIQDLTKAVTTVADRLITYCSQLLNYKNDFDPDVTKIIVNDFCPSLYALLGYGLVPNMKSMFGNVQNSLWRVVELTSPLTNPTKALHDLVLHVNSDEKINTGLKKFTAFIIGLLNIHSLDSWLVYLRLKEDVIQEHYHSHSFMFLSTTITKNLFDNLLGNLQPLASLPFKFNMDDACRMAESTQFPNFQSSFLNRHMNSSKSDESLSSLLSQARELRKVISQTSRTFQAPKCEEEATNNVREREKGHAQRPKSFAGYPAGATSEKNRKSTRPSSTYYPEKQTDVYEDETAVNSPTDEERIKHENDRRSHKNKRSSARMERKIEASKPESKASKMNSKSSVPKETTDKNKSDEVKFSELKQKWEMLSHDTNDHRKRASDKRKSSKLPGVTSPPSPQKQKPNVSKLPKKSFIPLPKSVGQSPASAKGSSLPVPARKSLNTSRQVSCPSKISSHRRNP